jgi:rod shape determining protein RodA
VLAAAWPLWFLALALLVLVLTPAGVSVNGARRWLRVGGVQIQPSEIAKVAEVLLLARYIRFREDHRTLKGLLVPFLLTLIPGLLILREPDLGTALLLVPPLFAMLWAAGARSRHLLVVVLFGVASLPLVYQNLKDYQQKRVDTYLPSWIRPTPDVGEAVLGAKERALLDQRERDANHHIERAEIAIAAGGVTGQGWGEGRMNVGNKVPEDWTDFIYVVHAEEWGFAGSVLLVSLFGLFFFAVASVAQECREPGARLLCVGALVTLGCQTCVNLMMTLRLAPVTGVPLPFLSYGRSAMLCSWVVVGLVLHAKAREPRVFTSSDFDK